VVGDGAVLARRVVTEATLPLGFPPLKDLIGFALEHSVPVFT